MTAESHGQNIPNYRYDSGHTAQGYFQITNTTWRGYAGAAGVDTSQYPTAMSAPYDVQRQVAGQIYDTRGFTDWSSSNPARLLGNPSNVTGPRDGGQASPLATTSFGQNALSTGNQSDYVPEGATGFGSQSDQGYATQAPRYLSPGEPGYDPSDPEGHMTNLSPSDWANFYNQGSSPGSSGSTGSPAGNARAGSSPGVTGGNVGTAAVTGAEAGTPGYLPPILTGGPAALGLTPGLGQALSSWVDSSQSRVGTEAEKINSTWLSWATGGLTDILGTAQNWFVRAMLILVALVILALALWSLLSKATGAPGPAQTAKAGAKAFA
jgi:hypothetical protein